MSSKYRDLDSKVRSAIDLIGDQRWETAYRDSQDREYRILNIESFSMNQVHDILAALDLLTITHTQKPMAPYKNAPKREYVPVIKVFSWSSIDRIIEMASNPDTTRIEIVDAVKKTAALTRFQRAFPNVDDFLLFQAMLESSDIKDHEKGGLLLRLDIDNVTAEALLELLKASGLDTNLIDFSFNESPETVFIPNEAFPDNAKPITIYEANDDATIIKQD